MSSYVGISGTLSKATIGCLSLEICLNCSELILFSESCCAASSISGKSLDRCDFLLADRHASFFSAVIPRASKASLPDSANRGGSTPSSSLTGARGLTIGASTDRGVSIKLEKGFLLANGAASSTTSAASLGAKSSAFFTIDLAIGLATAVASPLRNPITYPL